MKFCAPVSVSIVSTRFWTPDSFRCPPARVHLAVEIHQAADRGAVDVGDRRQIDEDVAVAGGDQAGDGGGEVGEQRIHQAGLADADDATAPACSVVTFINTLPCAGDRRPTRPPVRRAPRSCAICRASSVRPRLMRDLTVPSGSCSWSAISW